jgi:uncharacterized protein YaiI (UPF0178 family)
VSNITEALLPNAVPIDVPELHPQNYRQGDVDTIAGSLTRFGQVRPIVVQKSSGHVVAGNHTLKAARQLGWDQIAVVVVDMPDDEAEAYLVADNRASDKATNDDAALAKILERMMLAGKLEGTGYSPDDVDDMLAAMEQMPEVDPGDFEGGAATTDDQLAERFANRSQVALRQFVLMYDQDTATGVEAMFRKLERAWGMSGARDVVLEALKRATAEPPVEGLTVEEAERANIVPEADEPAADTVAQPVPAAPGSMPPVTVEEANAEVAAMVEDGAEADRPEQPEPDQLGGVPPSEPDDEPQPPPANGGQQQDRPTTLTEAAQAKPRSAIFDD